MKLKLIQQEIISKIDSQQPHSHNTSVTIGYTSMTIDHH